MVERADAGRHRRREHRHPQPPRYRVPKWAPLSVGADKFENPRLK